MGVAIALLRGINVGKARRVAMADLRSIIGDVGGKDPKTLLNSGNAVFGMTGKPAPMAAAIEKELASRLGVSSRVIVLSATDLSTVVKENTLARHATNPSRLLVAFPSSSSLLRKLAPLAKESWGDEALVIGSKAAYVWSPDGVLASRLLEGAERVLMDEVTTRNWATVLKLQALAESFA